MMRSKPSLKNSAKIALNRLILISLLFFFGCTSSTTPTYLKEDIDKAIQDICKNEYKLDVRARIIGSTLWVYLAVEDMLEKSDKPERYLEKFEIDKNDAAFLGGKIKLEYMIRGIPEKEGFQEVKYNKEVLEKINSVWRVMRRVLFSMERAEKKEPKFLCLVIADIKNGFETKELSYYLDLKKVSYDFISMGEYQHRSIQDVNIAPEIIGDKTGAHLVYKDIALEDFIVGQIQQRIKLKFQKPEVDKNVDIDKEISKIIVHTIKTYDFKDFSEVELSNLLTNNKVVLNQAAVMSRPIE